MLNDNSIMTYFFILGNNPTLSIAEIVNVLSLDLKKDDINAVSRQVLLLKTDKYLDLNMLQKQLGGTIKIGQIIKMRETQYPSLEKDIVNIVLKFLPKNLKKIYFGFSVYNIGNMSRKKHLEIKDMALSIKRKLKEQSISCRWVTSKDKTLSSVIIQKNKLLTHGFEIVLLIDKKQVLVGRTLSCQAFEEYSFYDFARPFREIKKGMLPPKLAKIMINLSRASVESTILDPFCGSGTIIQQALLMGYSNVIGTDKSKSAILSAKENIKWLKRNTDKQFGQVKIFQVDVRNISKKIDYVNAIITEPYLGPLRFKTSDLKFIIKELRRLYVDSFRQFKKILKPGGRIVIIFPVFRVNNKLHFLPILEDLKNIGWQAKAIISKYLLKNPVIRVTDRQSIIYSRPNQKILREIFVFKINK